jgi:hypothetical protein
VKITLTIPDRTNFDMAMVICNELVPEDQFVKQPYEVNPYSQDMKYSISFPTSEMAIMVEEAFREHEIPFLEYFQGSAVDFFDHQNALKESQEYARKNAVEARLRVELRCQENGGHDMQKIEDPNPRLRYCRSVYRCMKGCGFTQEF